MRNGRGEGKKSAGMSLESIIVFSSCWSEERKASEQRLRTTDRILPSCKATWGQEGLPGKVTWQQLTSCKGRLGSGHKYIRVTRRDTCLRLLIPWVNLNSCQVGNTYRENGWRGLGGIILCFLPQAGWESDVWGEVHQRETIQHVHLTNAKLLFVKLLRSLFTAVLTKTNQLVCEGLAARQSGRTRNVCVWQYKLGSCT